MSRPPVLARAVERGLSPFRGKRAAHLLPRARLGGPMPWVIAIMVALTVLATAGGMALSNLVARASGDLAGSATIQIVDPDPAGRATQARAVATTLAEDPRVTDIRILPDAEVEALLEPWLGAGAGDETLPIPTLIDIRLIGPVDDAETARLADLLAAVAPDARVDAQSDWLAPVLGALSALRWVAFGLIALLGFTAAASVWLAARNALNTNRETIEIVHLLGGNDSQIARIFQRSILLDALIGGLLGPVLGFLAVLAMGAQFAALDSALVAGGDLSTGDWLLLGLVPLFAIAIAVYTARMTVLSSLRKML